MPRIERGVRLRMSNSLRACVLAGALVFAQPSQAAMCPPYAEAIVLAAKTAMQAALEQLVNQLFSMFTDQLNFFAQLKAAAVKVVNSQVSVAARAQINFEQDLKKGEMSARALLESTKQQLRVFQDYSPQTGQGVDPCRQLQYQRAVIAATASAVSTAAQMTGKLSAASGRFGEAIGYIDTLLASRRANFATADEEKLGLGKASTATVVTNSGDVVALAGADTNADVLFADSNDSRVQQAKQNYLNYVAGPPDAPVSAAAVSTSAGKQYLQSKATKDSAMSVGMNSVAQVAAENSPFDEGQGVSKITAMKNMVGMYYGETAKDVWRAWMSQSDRGLEIDSIKMSAATLAVEIDQLEQARRIEANVAALLGMRAQRLKPQVEAAGQNAIEQTLRIPSR